MTGEGCYQFGELCAMVAAGAATHEEERALAAHLTQGCPDCTVYFHTMQETTAILVESLPPQSPPPAVRSRLLKTIAQESLHSDQRPVAERRPSEGSQGFLAALSNRLGSGTMGWAFAALLVVALIGGSAFHIQSVSEFESELQRLQILVTEKEAEIGFMKARQTQVVAFKGSDPSPSAVAKGFWNAETNAGILITFGLPPLPPDKVYQLWAIQEAKPPVDAGIFELDSEGVGTLRMKPIPNPKQPVQLFAITLEPTGGSPGPTSAIYLKGAPVED